MDLSKLQSLLPSASRVGNRPKKQGKKGAFERELAEEGGSPDKAQSQGKESEESRHSLLAKKTTPKQSSHTKGLKIDLFA
ncbi:MAG TPA: hypothetical protein ENK02_05460 [Planctomycetes bacterium]|nr:hypothetical protein [Planctomycetota bacterium]